MGKTQLVLDTSAIISLGCTGKFRLIRHVFNLNSPMRVKGELEEMSKRKAKKDLSALRKAYL